MNREFLKELGLEDEAINKVMSEYGKSVNSYKEKIEELEGLSEKVEGYEQQLGELKNSLESKEEELSSIEDLKKENETLKLNELKMNIARQANIPFELAGRLSGESEEEIKADAEKLAGFVNKKQPLPLKTTEPPKVDEKEQAYAKILENL